MVVLQEVSYFSARKEKKRGRGIRNRSLFSLLAVVHYRLDGTMTGLGSERKSVHSGLDIYILLEQARKEVKQKVQIKKKGNLVSLLAPSLQSSSLNATSSTPPKSLPSPPPRPKASRICLSPVRRKRNKRWERRVNFLPSSKRQERRGWGREFAYIHNLLHQLRILDIQELFDQISIDEPDRRGRSVVGFEVSPAVRIAGLVSLRRTNEVERMRREERGSWNLPRERHTSRPLHNSAHVPLKIEEKPRKFAV